MRRLCRKIFAKHVFLIFLKVLGFVFVIRGTDLFAQIQMEQHSQDHEVYNSPTDDFVKKRESAADPRRNNSEINVRQIPSGVFKPSVLPARDKQPVEAVQEDLNSPLVDSKSQTPNKIQDAPDERILWRHYNARRYSALAAQITNFKRRFPEWSPPSQLIRLMNDQRRSSMLKQALLASQWQKIIQIAQRNPAYFDCTRVDVVWSLAQAYAMNDQQKQSAEQYAYVINRCGKDPLKIASLQKAAQYLSAVWMEGLWSVAESVISEDSARRKVELLHYYYDKNRFIAAQDNKLEPESGNLAKAIEGRAETFRDLDAANILAWYYFQANHYENAILWFKKAHSWQPDNEKTTYGLALSLNKAGHYEKAAAVAKTIAAESEKGKKLLGEIQLQLAWSRFKNQDYSESRKLARQASEILQPNRDAELLLAWLDYREKKYQSAVTSFESLYQENPDMPTAKGLAQSYAALDSGQLAELSKTHSGGALGKQLKQLYSQELYWRKHFLAANEQAAEQFPKLENIDSPWMSVGALYRSRTGDNGLNRLDIFSIPLIEAMYVHNRVHRMALHYDRVSLNSRNPANCAPIGSLPIQAPCLNPNVSLSLQPPLTRPTIALNSGNRLRQDPTTRLNGGHSLEFSYFRDGWYTPFFSLGVTPINGVISPRPTVRLGFLKEFSQGRWGSELYSQPVRESILSYTGINDPYSNTQWGRVLRSGINLPLLLSLDEDWTLTANVDVALLHGEQVKTNWTVAGTVSTGYDFKLSGFDYFSLGPSVSFQHYDQNQNHFTVGHGGYFSPERLINTGLGLNFLTSEGRSFVLRGRVGAGYQNVQNASSPWFPLGGSVQNAANVQVTLDGRSVFNDTPTYASSANDGLAYDLELKGVWLLHPNIQVGGGVSARRTGGYDDYSAGFFFRYILDERKASFSSDIPDYLFRKLY